MRRLIAPVLLCLALSILPAHAQSTGILVVSSCGDQTFNSGATVAPLTVDTTGKLCSAAAVSASISGFAPATTGTPIGVTTGGVTGSLPAGAVVAAFNVGTTNTAYCKLGASATTSDIAIPPQSWFAYTVGSATQMTCITSTSTTTVNMVGGTGLPTGAGGGGGGGSGGGGAITIASGAVASGAYSAGSLAAGAGVDGWDLTQGTKADAAYAGSGSASVVAGLKGIYANQTSIIGTKAPGTAAASAALTGGVYNSAGVTLTTGQQASLQLDSAGNLKITGAGGGGTSSSFGSAFPTAGTAIGITNGTNMVGWPGDATNGGFVQAKSGTFVDGAIATVGAEADAACASDTATCSLIAILKLANQHLTTINGSIGSSIPAGTNTIGAVTQASGPWSQNVTQFGGSAVATGTGAGGAGIPRVTVSNDSTVGLVSGTTVQPIPGTTNGCTPYHLSGGTTASTNSTSIKGSAGNLCDLIVVNTSTTLGYLKIYDSATAPTCSSATNIKHVYPVPFGPSNIGAGIGRQIAMGESYANGIGYCFTGGGSDTDNTSGPAGVFIEASFK